MHRPRRRGGGENSGDVPRRQKTGGGELPTRRHRPRGDDPPAKVATAIVQAIEQDRSVVPVGREAWIGWWLNRYLPIHAHQALIRKLPLT